MPKLSFERHVPFSPMQMFSLVADMASYPDFVPNCADMQIENGENGNTCYATMFVQLGPISQSYTSKVIIDKKAKIIQSLSDDGPFSYLDSRWEFVSENDGTNILLNIEYEFANSLLSKIAEPIFAQKQSEILDAFVKEAKKRFT